MILLIASVYSCLGKLSNQKHYAYAGNILKTRNEEQDPHKKAQLFGVLFGELPTYDDLDYGTQKTPLFTGVNSVFSLLKLEKSLLVISRRIELRLPG